MSTPENESPPATSASKWHRDMCRVCRNDIQVQAHKGSGFCSQVCRKVFDAQVDPS
jgi:hypothetical protein